MRAIISFIKVVSDLKFGHFYFSWPPLTSVTSEVRGKTSNLIVDFDVEKRENCVTNCKNIVAIPLKTACIVSFLKPHQCIPNANDDV